MIRVICDGLSPQVVRLVEKSFQRVAFGQRTVHIDVDYFRICDVPPVELRLSGMVESVVDFHQTSSNGFFGSIDVGGVCGRGVGYVPGFIFDVTIARSVAAETERC
jgi:hypothetical protein